MLEVGAHEDQAAGAALTVGGADPGLGEALTENMQQLGSHVTILTNAYEELLKNVNEMINVSNAVARDMNELMR